MTREEALTGHRKLWNEIADMIERGYHYDNDLLYKYDALHHLGDEEMLRKGRFCYLCEDDSIDKSCVNNCAVVWKRETCMHNDSEYQKFQKLLMTRDYTQAAILARKIANLPERVVE